MGDKLQSFLLFLILKSTYVWVLYWNYYVSVFANVPDVEYFIFSLHYEELMHYASPSNIYINFVMHAKFNNTIMFMCIVTKEELPIKKEDGGRLGIKSDIKFGI